MLTTISDIKAMSLDVEDKIRDIQERYRTLSMYDIEVCIGLNTNMGQQQQGVNARVIYLLLYSIVPYSPYYLHSSYCYLM